MRAKDLQSRSLRSQTPNTIPMDIAEGNHGGKERDGHYTEVPLTVPKQDEAEIVKVPGAPPPNSMGPADDDPTHLLNWLQAMRDRKQPAATVDDGFSHSVACIMATQSYWSGQKLYWDPQSETILEHQPSERPVAS